MLPGMPIRDPFLPLPECQVDLYDEYGTFLGRTEFWWELFGVAGRPMA